jgi:hypothetical protein
MPLTIQKLTAFITIDEKGEEGIISFLDPKTQTIMPLVCADEARIKSMYPMAVKICSAFGKSFKIMEFTNCRDVTEEISNKYGD